MGSSLSRRGWGPPGGKPSVEGAEGPPGERPSVGGARGPPQGRPSVVGAGVLELVWSQGEDVHQAVAGITRQFELASSPSKREVPVPGWHSLSGSW